eukprot:4662166-Pleurochrysis_carterae.AAC.1
MRNAPAGGWLPAQCVSRTQAMRGYTTDAAFAMFQARGRARAWSGWGTVTFSVPYFGVGWGRGDWQVVIETRKRQGEVLD